MTLEEQGAYFRLLCYGWRSDGIPSDRRELALLLGLEPGSERAERLLSRVLDLAWKTDADNPRTLRNDRQEEERAKSERLYSLKTDQMAKARAANPKNAKRFQHNKGLTDNHSHNHTLLRERAAQSSEPEPQEIHAVIPPAIWEEIKAKLHPQHGEPTA
jgi:uncharacterized protein YdaU (DUF1376 family)